VTWHCITYDDTVPEAVTMAKEAIELYVESLIAHGEAIPNYFG
jgi:predicted RNase H-like HicB family nuclease